MNTFNANTFAMSGNVIDSWWGVLQQAWSNRFAERGALAATADAAEDKQRIEAAAYLRERICAYESSQPSYAADLRAALAQLERTSTTR